MDEATRLKANSFTAQLTGVGILLEKELFSNTPREDQLRYFRLKALNLRESIEQFLESTKDQASRLYVLSDGHEADQVKRMTPAELAEAQKQAEEATDGNWGWYPVEKEGEY